MFALIVLVLLPAATHAQAVSAALRGGFYADGDDTQVVRTLADVEARWEHLGISMRELVDVVSSASADVRASPQLDALSGASLTAPRMSERRFETTLTLSWRDRGRGLDTAVSFVHAVESDYSSIGGGLHGAYTLPGSNTTLAAELTGTANWIASTDDPTLARKLATLGISLGATQLLGPRDILHLRYDGAYLSGYQASPYRVVRFGDWHTALRPGGIGLLFIGTSGPARREELPTTRLRHAVVAEWRHAITTAFALATGVRPAIDDWGLTAVALTVDGRWASGAWRGHLGYRVYLQNGASFYRPRYLTVPTHYTADRELGPERGHLARLGLGYSPSTTPWIAVDLEVDLLHYAYPDLILAPDARISLFAELGVRIEL